MQRRGSMAGSRSSNVEDAPAQRERVAVEKLQRARTLPSDAATAASKLAVRSGSSARRPAASAAARLTCSADSGRNASSRQRERMVGSTRAAEWLTSSSRARRGGSSSTLSRALAPSRLSSSTESTMATRHPPSPARRAEKGHRPAHVVDLDILAQLVGLLVDRALQHQEIAVRLRRRCVARPDDRRRQRARLPSAPRARADRDARARNAPCGRRASPCRCRRARSAARHGRGARSR